MANADGFIKFDPVQILDVSVNIDLQHKNFSEYTDNIKKKADGLKGIWHGDSANLFAQKINELTIKDADIIKYFTALSKDLVNASGIYKTSESDAKTQAQGLPTEGVFKI